MNTTTDFQQLLARVRAGDDDAAAELVQQYEADIQRVIRVKLTDPNLRRSVETLDIYQSVLAQFFVRVRMGQFDLTEPSDLTRLLKTMVKNKIRDKARMPAHRKTHSADSGLLRTVAASGETPVELAAGAEMTALATAAMTAAEIQLVAWRKDGKSWDEIGGLLKVTADTARKRLKRALDRVLPDIGIECPADE